MDACHWNNNVAQNAEAFALQKRSLVEGDEKLDQSDGPTRWHLPLGDHSEKPVPSLTWLDSTKLENMLFLECSKAAESHPEFQT